MIYLILLLQTLSIGFLYYKLYKKPKVVANPIVRRMVLPADFMEKATPNPKQEVVVPLPSKPFRRASYNTPRED